MNSETHLTLILAGLSLISNDRLRLVAILVVTSVAVAASVYAAQQLTRVDALIADAEDLLLEAKMNRTGWSLALEDAEVRLLGIKQSASIAACMLLERPRTATLSERFRNYRQTSRKVADCVQEAKDVRAATKLAIEMDKRTSYASEAQRRSEGLRLRTALSEGRD
ncbi:hypothetical protein MKEN_00946100 [Mycena kentingensis (nom. inval.)]|nr:hypothetical protein MKEN_00946100 [Mycena kentingensis (nom. inval.)]